MTAIAEHKPQDMQIAPERQGNPIMDMIREAVQSGQPIEVIRELKDMAKELASDEAQRAFNAAFADFKAEAVEVARNREVTDGPLKGRRYAELVSFVEAAVPALSKHGLSHSWAITRDDKDWIEVTCIIEHSLGGNKKVSLGGAPDSGGAKNSLQARISTVTYLERATFKAACGLAEKGDDDDGAAAGKGVATVSEDQIAELQALIDDVGGENAASLKTELLAWAKRDRLADIPADKFNNVVQAINNRRQK